MRTEWGRDERTDWPSSKPVYTIALLILSVAAGAGVECVRYLRDWTPLERQYLLAYVGTEVAGTVRQNARYTLLEVVTQRGSRLAGQARWRGSLGSPLTELPYMIAPTMRGMGLSPLN